MHHSICDRFKQKQACGCVLTSPLYITPLCPGFVFVQKLMFILNEEDSCVNVENGIVRLWEPDTDVVEIM